MPSERYFITNHSYLTPNIVSFPQRAPHPIFAKLLSIIHCQLSIKKMTVYEAIDRMRELSRKRIAFSFSFMSYSIARRKSEGIVTVRRARLNKQSRKERNRYADYMLQYTDLDTGETASCWQPLLLELNGEEVELV